MSSLGRANLLPHQEAALTRLRELDGRGGLFMAMGSGKTRTALEYCAERGSRRILIVLPLSVTSVWEREIGNTAVELPIVDLTILGTVKDRAQAVGRAKDALLLINYESYWREPLRSAIVRWSPDTVILDEAHRIRHRSSKQARFAHILGAKVTVRTKLALTGTPITNGLEDAWSIFRFLTPDTFGRWADFEHRYLKLGGFQFRQITGYQNVEEAKAVIAAHSYQWEGVMPKPPDVPIRVRLSPSSRKVYDELKKKAIVEIVNARGESRTVLATLALTLVLRLQQITSGFAKEVGEEEIEVGTEKAEATRDLVSDAVANHQRIVIFVRFLHDLRLLRETLSSYRIGEITGASRAQDRKDTVRDFDAGRYDLLIVQIKAGGLGIDLAAASIAIFYSVGFSLDEFLQAKGRLSGDLRQRHPVTFYHAIVENSVDEKIYKALSSKTVIARAATDLSYALDLLGVDRDSQHMQDQETGSGAETRPLVGATST